jgi:hypothetical protein
VLVREDMRAKRTDKNQAGIVDALRDHFQVIVTNMGDAYPDLMVGFDGFWHLLEVKQPNGCLDRGQLEFMANSIGPVSVVTNEQEAIDAIYEGGISGNQRGQIHIWLIKNPTQDTLSVRKFRAVIGEAI